MSKQNENQFFTEPGIDESKDPRVQLAVKILKQMQDSLSNVVQLLEQGSTDEAVRAMSKLSTDKAQLDADVAQATGARVIEGVFDGVNMVGSDGNVYTVPANYASKSRLVEGDILKLTIKNDGSFIFKQIGPIERRRTVGTLAEDTETGEFAVLGPDGTTWRVLRASVTYFHGMPGDDVVILTPKSAPSTWAAVENVVKK